MHVLYITHIEYTVQAHVQYMYTGTHMHILHKDREESEDCLLLLKQTQVETSITVVSL